MAEETQQKQAARALYSLLFPSEDPDDALYVEKNAAPQESPAAGSPTTPPPTYEAATFFSDVCQQIFPGVFANAAAMVTAIVSISEIQGGNGNK